MAPNYRSTHANDSLQRRAAPEINGSEGGFIGLIIGLLVIIILCCLVVIHLLRGPEPSPADRARRQRALTEQQEHASSLGDVTSKITNMFSRSDPSVPPQRSFSLESGRKVMRSLTRGMSLTSNDRRVHGWLQASGDDWDDADEPRSPPMSFQDHAHTRLSRSTFGSAKYDDPYAPGSGISNPFRNSREAEDEVALVRLPALGVAQLHTHEAGHPARQGSMSVEGESVEGGDWSGSDTAEVRTLDEKIYGHGRGASVDSAATATSPTSWTFERGTKFKEDV